MATKLNESQNSVTYQLTVVAANATNASEALDLTGYRSVSVQSIHANHSDTSTWVIQGSNDEGTTYVTVPSATETTATAAGSNIESVSDWTYGYLKMYVSEADASATATLTFYVVAKR